MRSICCHGTLAFRPALRGRGGPPVAAVRGSESPPPSPDAPKGATRFLDISAVMSG